MKMSAMPMSKDYDKCTHQWAFLDKIVDPFHAKDRYKVFCIWCLEIKEIEEIKES